jgi:hypothetical protein
MNLFLHGRVQQLTQLLQACNVLLGQYNRSDPTLSTDLSLFLDTLSAAYRKMARHDIEGKALALKAELVTVHRGVDPRTLERIVGRRREVEAGVAFKILQTSHEQLRADLQSDARTLVEAKALLGPVLLASLQRGLIVGSELSKGSYKRQAKVEILWKLIRIDAALSLAANQISQTLSVHDVVILMIELLAGMTALPG